MDCRASIEAAGRAHSLRNRAPGWAALEDGLARASDMISSPSLGRGAVGADAGDVGSRAQDWSVRVERATEAVLLWAQGVAAVQPASGDK